MIGRRGFLASILAAGVAPAAVGSGILMPVRRIADPYEILLPSWFALDASFERDWGISSLVRRGPRGWEVFEISLVDARGWSADDPCRIPAGMSFSEFHLGLPTSHQDSAMT